MKLLQSRLLVGLLVAAAAALVFKNVVWSLMHRSSSGKPAQKVAGVPSQSAAAPANKPIATSAAPPQTPKEKEPGLTLARTNLQPWVGTPQRDPFLIRLGTTNQSGTFPTAMEVLTLNAILRQSGSTLVVINNRVLAEGEVIQGFKVLSIGSEKVWLEGPSGREQLIFDYTSSMRLNPLNPGGNLNGPLIAQATRLDWLYRVVDGATNNAATDKGWFLIGGMVLQKLGTGHYLISVQPEKDQPSPLLKGQRCIVKNVPLSLVDDDTLPPIRCKYVGDESQQERTLRVFDFGLLCAPPAKTAESLVAQRAFLVQQHDEANARRINAEMEAAEKGNATAQYMVGRRYLEGDGVPKDLKQARLWLEKSAALGNRDAHAMQALIDAQE